MELAVQIAMGVSVAACAGLRAFLPLLVIGLLARYTDHVELAQPFQWLTSDAALIVFGVATLVELLADKLPVVDHALDAVQTVVRPIAGMLAVAALAADLSPVLAAVVGVILGAPIAAKIHLTKVGTRLVSTHVTLGMANALVSAVEDVVSLAGVVLAAFAPLVALLLTVAGLYLAFRVSAKVRERLRDLGLGLFGGPAAAARRSRTADA